MPETSTEAILSEFEDILDAPSVDALSQSAALNEPFKQMDRQERSRVAAMLRRDASAANDERTGTGGGNARD